MKLGRINVVTDLWIGSSEAVRDVINQLLEQNGGDKVDVLLTPAGFLWAEIEGEEIPSRLPRFFSTLFLYFFTLHGKHAVHILLHRHS